MQPTEDEENDPRRKKFPHLALAALSGTNAAMHLAGFGVSIPAENDGLF
jgi:hypothetical protein